MEKSGKFVSPKMLEPCLDLKITQMPSLLSSQIHSTST